MFKIFEKHQKRKLGGTANYCHGAFQILHHYRRSGRGLSFGARLGSVMSLRDV
jgi:hypothetical protein